MSGHPSNDPARARLLRCASEDLSHTGTNLPPGPPLDIPSSLFGQPSSQSVRFPPAGPSIPGRQQQVVVDQLQQQQQQRLLTGLLSSNMPLGPAQNQALQVSLVQIKCANKKRCRFYETMPMTAMQKKDGKRRFEVMNLYNSIITICDISTS